MSPTGIAEAKDGSSMGEGLGKALVRFHADLVPTVPPRLMLDALDTLVGKTKTGTVWLSLRGPLTHHIV